MKFKTLIDDITIDLWFSQNFVSIEDIIRTCKPTVRFSKFTLKIYIYIERIWKISLQT